MKLMKKRFRYINQFCEEKCVNNLRSGHLQCQCGEIGLYEWVWCDGGICNVKYNQNNTEIQFHPRYSSGTAVTCGEQLLKKNFHHYWEMKMLSNIYGTDVMVGVGTPAAAWTNWSSRFFSFLGSDNHSWGYSYNGVTQHGGEFRTYGSKFGLGSLIGVHVDMFEGTLEFYLNRQPLGIAFRGLKGQDLYPMVCSTAAQSGMKMTCSATFETSLEFACLKLVTRNPRLLDQLKSIPGLLRIYEKKYFWLLSKESEEWKRKMRLPDGSALSPGEDYCKRLKLILPLPQCFRSPALDNTDSDSNSSD